jgi:hypothetical protein
MSSFFIFIENTYFNGSKKATATAAAFLHFIPVGGN